MASVSIPGISRASSTHRFDIDSAGSKGVRSYPYTPTGVLLRTFVRGWQLLKSFRNCRRTRGGLAALTPCGSSVAISKANGRLHRVYDRHFGDRGWWD
jgi:hypothetical protein